MASGGADNCDRNSSQRSTSLILKRMFGPVLKPSTLKYGHADTEAGRGNRAASKKSQEQMIC